MIGRPDHPTQPVGLRDFFAGEALVAWMRDPDVKQSGDVKVLAALCYELADAMIVARDRAHEKQPRGAADPTLLRDLIAAAERAVNVIASLTPNVPENATLHIAQKVDREATKADKAREALRRAIDRIQAAQAGVHPDQPRDARGHFYWPPLPTDPAAFETPEEASMKIVALEAENVKRLRAVEITPQGNVVEIAGKNGQGKTSILDAIWWALSGTKHIQAEPIRKGANEARIRLDLGDIKVVRTFRRKGDEQPSTLVVESADGARFPSPQLMLDKLVGALSFDPLAFTRLDGKGKFDALKQFVPGVDFDALAAEHKADFAARTDLNRRAKEAKAAADVIHIPHGTPEEPIDETALVAELEQAGEQNTVLEQRKARREQAEESIRRHRALAETCRTSIAKLREEIATIEEDMAEHVEKAKELEEKLADAEPLPAPVETSAIRARIQEAREVNAAVARRAERSRLLGKFDELDAESKTLTDRMDARQKAKNSAIAAAKMPIPGIEFGDGEVLLNGVPFDQASDAEQLRASIAIAMAANPKLRVIRVRDGSLLDDESMAIVAEMAAEKDCQVWVETVGAGKGPAAVVIEDGMVKAVPAQAAE